MQNFGHVHTESKKDKRQGAGSEYWARNVVVVGQPKRNISGWAALEKDMNTYWLAGQPTSKLSLRTGLKHNLQLKTFHYLLRKCVCQCLSTVHN